MLRCRSRSKWETGDGSKERTPLSRNTAQWSGTFRQHIKRIEEFTHIVFSSASGVTAFFEEMEKNKKTFSHNIKTVCIGDVTAAKLKKYGVESDLIASVFDVNGLLEAVRDG